MKFQEVFQRIFMTQLFQSLTKRHINVIKDITGLGVVISILIGAMCLTTSRANAQLVFPPQVVSVTPASGATGVPAGVTPRAVFNDVLDPFSVNSSTVMLRDAENNLVPANVSWDALAFAVTLNPEHPLQPGQTYTITLKGGSALPHINNLLGVPLPSNYVWSFTITGGGATPPQVVSVTPAAGATGVSTGVAPRAVFSEAL